MLNLDAFSDEGYRDIIPAGPFTRTEVTVACTSSTRMFLSLAGFSSCCTNDLPSDFAELAHLARHPVSARFFPID